MPTADIYNSVIYIELVHQPFWYIFNILVNINFQSALYFFLQSASDKVKQEVKSIQFQK